MDGYLTMFDFTVEVRDGDLNRLGQILREDLNLTLTDRFNNVGEWTLTLPIEHPMVPALRTPGAGLVVTVASGPLAGQTLASGPMVSPEVTVSGADPGTVTVAGATDSVLLADRRAHPAPSTLDPADASHDVRTGPAETLMRQYVTANLSAAAHPSRADERVVVPASLGRGATSTQRARFPVLGGLLAGIAAGANYPAVRESYHPGHLGFRLVQVDSTLEFQVYEVADRAADVRLDVDNGTLASHKVTTAAPSVTHVIVAGQGEGTDRQFVERTTAEATAAASAWRRRIELLKDQRATGDESELEQAGDAELAEGGLSQYAMEIVPGDDTGWEFGADWNLGDIVSVVVRDGGENRYAATEYATVVTGYVLKADASGVRMGAILGAPKESDMQRVERRLSNLEANAEGGAGAVDGRLSEVEDQLDTVATALDVVENRLIVVETLAPEVIETDLTLSAQWYRIATLTPVSNANKASAEFTLATDVSGEHMFLRFAVAYAYNARNGASLEMLECGGYSTTNGVTYPPFSRIRLVPVSSTYEGVHVEVLSRSVKTTKMRLEVKHREWPNGGKFTPVNFTPQGTTEVDWIMRGVFWTSRWTALTLLNGWTNYGTGYPFGEFRMHPGSLVEVRGMVANGTASDIAQLPEGARPQYRLLLPSIGGGNSLGRIDVTNTGFINYQAGTKSFMTLDAIRFTAEQ
jgi:hypothetical protein